MSLSTSAFLVALGLIPSLVWVLIFLRNDRHPEPKYLITKTFLMGIIVSPLAIILQLGFIALHPWFNLSILNAQSPSFFVWAALVEEVVKYLAVRTVVLKNPEFDEPVDAMVYMMVAGLGFAAIENILVLFRTIPDGTTILLATWGLRSVGATLLHALASSLVGYFLAISWFFQAHHKKLLIVGISVATFFHFVFNMFLSNVDSRINGLAYAIGLLIIMLFLVSILFAKIKSRKPQPMTKAMLIPQTEITVA